MTPTNDWSITVMKAGKAALLAFVVIMLTQVAGIAESTGIKIDVDVMAGAIVSAVVALITGLLNWIKHRKG